MFLVDTNIIIYHLNQGSTASDFLIKNYNEISISFITFIEVLSYPYKNDEEKNIRDLLNEFKLFTIDQGIINQSIQYRRMKKIKLPDNIIASTAYINDLILVTRTVKDFENLGIKVLNPIDDK